jgi:hypothetical protein
LNRLQAAMHLSTLYWQCYTIINLILMMSLLGCETGKQDS